MSSLEDSIGRLADAIGSLATAIQGAQSVLPSTAAAPAPSTAAQTTAPGTRRRRTNAEIEADKAAVAAALAENGAVSDPDKAQPEPERRPANPLYQAAAVAIAETAAPPTLEEVKAKLVALVQKDGMDKGRAVGIMERIDGANRLPDVKAINYAAIVAEADKLLGVANGDDL